MPRTRPSIRLLAFAGIAVAALLPAAALAFNLLGSEVPATRMTEGVEAEESPTPPLSTPEAHATEAGDYEVTGGRKVPSPGGIHNLPTAAPPQVPDTRNAADVQTALGRMQTIPSLAVVLDRIANQDAAGIVALMQGEDGWRCSGTRWGFTSEEDCLSDPATNGDGTYRVVYWGGMRLPARDMRLVLERVFDRELSPVVAFQFEGPGRYVIHFALEESVDASPMLDTFSQYTLSSISFAIYPDDDQPIRSIGTLESLDTLPRVIEASRVPHLLLFPASLDEIPGWTEYAPSFGQSSQ